MTQLTFQPALDPFHSIFRLLRLRPLIDRFGPMARDQVRILDFYLLFPFRIREVRLLSSHQKYKHLAEKYLHLKPYGELPDPPLVSAELKSLYTVLGQTDQAFTTEWIESQRDSLATERITLQTALEEAEKKLYAEPTDDEFTLSEQERTYTELQTIQADLGKARHDRDALVLTIADSDAFILSLKSKIEALRDSANVAEHFGEVRFESCPACYAPLEKSGEHVCHLCKTPFDSEQTRSRIAALIIDTGLQAKQSEQLQADRRERYARLSDAIVKFETDWRKVSERLSSVQRIPSTKSRQQLRDLQRRLGYLDRQIEDLEQKGRLVLTIRDLIERKDNLNDEITRLKSANEALRAQQQERLSVAYTRISDEVKILLRNDLRRQDIFEDPKHVSFTFGENRMLVDDEHYFSASSRAILKSCFYLGFLAAATKLPFFRHPRFCMIDTLENMGVESIRSQNFQLQILRISRETKVEHQIIYATAMIEPELEDEAYTIGAFSTNDDKTIGIKLN